MSFKKKLLNSLYSFEKNSNYDIIINNILFLKAEYIDVNKFFIENLSFINTISCILFVIFLCIFLLRMDYDT